MCSQGVQGHAPGHSKSLHVRVIVASPTQSFAMTSVSLMLTHDLDLDCWPWSHDSEQLPQPVHVLHAPARSVWMRHMVYVLKTVSWQNIIRSDIFKKKRQYYIRLKFNLSIYSTTLYNDQRFSNIFGNLSWCSERYDEHLIIGIDQVFLWVDVRFDYDLVEHPRRPTEY